MFNHKTLLMLKLRVVNRARLKAFHASGRLAGVLIYQPYMPLYVTPDIVPDPAHRHAQRP